MNQNESRPRLAIPVLSGWVRGILAGLALGLMGVFALAFVVNPYDENGEAHKMETHRQLGLPPCTFQTATGGLPCPSCGMTTSFALLVRGDVWNSLRANSVGTLLALLWVVMIPWSILCAVAGRPYVVWYFEPMLTRLILVFLGLALARWGIVAICWYWSH